MRSKKIPILRISKKKGVKIPENIESVRKSISNL